MIVMCGPALDLGGGHRLNFFSRYEPRLLSEEESEAIGGTHDHPNQKTPGEMCAGVVFFRGKRPADNPGPEWDVQSVEPLTLAPSLLCRTCGCHGHIENGRWVPC